VFFPFKATNRCTSRSHSTDPGRWRCAHGKNSKKIYVKLKSVSFVHWFDFNLEYVNVLWVPLGFCVSTVMCAYVAAIFWFNALSRLEFRRKLRLENSLLLPCLYPFGAQLLGKTLRSARAYVFEFSCQWKQFVALLTQWLQCWALQPLATRHRENYLTPKTKDSNVWLCSNIQLPLLFQYQGQHSSLYWCQQIMTRSWKSIGIITWKHIKG